jgi:manganese transport protein
MFYERLSLNALKTTLSRSKGAAWVRSFIIYLGPTLIVSMAYMDPGNYGTGIQAGASFDYDLIWAVWAASLFAMILQYLSGKLGIATNHSLPELLRGSLKKRRYIIPYWLGAEIAAAATDLAEYLGTVIAKGPGSCRRPAG